MPNTIEIRGTIFSSVNLADSVISNVVFEIEVARESVDACDPRQEVPCVAFVS